MALKGPTGLAANSEWGGGGGAGGFRGSCFLTSTKAEATHKWVPADPNSQTFLPPPPKPRSLRLHRGLWDYGSSQTVENRLCHFSWPGARIANPHRSPPRPPWWGGTTSESRNHGVCFFLKTASLPRKGGWQGGSICFLFSLVVLFYSL